MEEVKKEWSDRIERLKTGQKIAMISTLVLLLLAFLKAVVGYRFNSKILIADALHNGADVLINFTSMLGLWLASWKKSTRFPYGLYRAETLACLLIGGVIIFVGIELFKDGTNKLFQLAHAEKFPAFPAAAAAISSVTAFFLAKKQRDVGRIIGSLALITTSREAFYDIFTSLIVLAGILLAYANISYVEGTVIIIISLLIFKLGLKTGWTSLMILLDANMDVALQSEIEAKINRIYGVKGVGEVKIRRSGPFKMVECIIETSPALSLHKAHEMADKAENVLSRNYDNIESVFIHVEPKSKKALLAIIPVQDINNLSSRLHGHFGRAPYFLILKINNDHTEIEDFYFNEFLEDKGHIGLKVVKTIVDYKIDLVFVSQIGEIAFHMLKNNFVDIYKADEGIAVEKIIKLYHLKQLNPIVGPTHLAEKSQFAKMM